MRKEFQGKENCRVGVISDTHGQIPQSALLGFAGVDLIIHAGDIGKPEILQALRKVAPTVAVRGNMDMDKWARDLPEKEIIAASNIVLVVLHDLHKLNSNPDELGYRVVISGHTHRPLAKEDRGVLYLNPGSAGLPKSGDPATVALLQINGDSIDPRIIALTSKF